MRFSSIAYNIILLDMLVSQVSFDIATKNAVLQTVLADVVNFSEKDSIFIMSNGLRLSWDKKRLEIACSAHDLDEVMLRWAYAAKLRAVISNSILEEINEWTNKQRGR